MRYGRRLNRRSKLAQDRSEARLFKLGIFVLVGLVVLSGVIYLTRIDRLHIKDVVVSGNSITATKEIEEVVTNNLAGLYFKMFTKRNSFIYPKYKIRKDIENRFKRIERVELSVLGFEKIKVEVIERAPDALWCGSNYEDTGGCYFLDSDGLIYSRAPDFSGNVFFRVYGSIGGVDPIGKHFLSIAGYQSFNFFKTSMEQFGLTPVSLIKLEEGDLEVTLDDGMRIIYNSEQDVVNLSEDLISIMGDPEFKTDLEGRAGLLDYIDLRFGNKVYFKLK